MTGNMMPIKTVAHTQATHLSYIPGVHGNKRCALRNGRISRDSRLMLE